MRAALELAAAEHPPLKRDQIATAQEIPVKFLETILGELKHAGIVASQRGADGGYSLARPPDEITLADVLRVMDGPLASVRDQRPESVSYSGSAETLQEVWVALRSNMRAVLEQVTLADVVAASSARRGRQADSRPRSLELDLMLFRQVVHEDLELRLLPGRRRARGRRRGRRSPVGHRPLPAPEPPPRGPDRACARDPQPRGPRLRTRPAGPGHGRDHPHPRARRGRVPARAVRRRLEASHRRPGDRGDAHARPPPRAHLVRAARRRARRRRLGRPDRRLAVRRRRRPPRPRGRAARRRGRDLRSLHDRLLALDDDVEVWPGHLGGSLCGSSAIDNKTSSTIGFERRHNRGTRASRASSRSSPPRSPSSATARPTSSTSWRSTAAP